MSSFYAIMQIVKNLIYVTSSKIKIDKARINLEPLGVLLQQENCEMVELQLDDGEKIVRHKAEQAFAVFEQPLLVSDDTWSIPALRGFPGINMKQCNHFLRAEDWLKLMQGQDDRRIFLTAYYAYHDGKEVQYFSHQSQFSFLNTSQGHHETSPCLEVIGRAGSGKSVAEELTAGRTAENDTDGFWESLATAIKKEH